MNLQHKRNTFASMKVLVAGASGLIGNNLLLELISDNQISEITILVRNELQLSNSKVKQVIFDFNNEKSYKGFPTYDAIFCCLGTTIKKAKSKENYLKIDYDYPLHIAKHVKTQKYLLVSSIGANINSPFFYTKSKGRLEEELIKFNFDSLHIFRPSQLSGNRKEYRLSEKISKPIFNFLNPIIPTNFQLIKASVVAKAMKLKALTTQKGTQIYLSGEIKKIVSNDI